MKKILFTACILLACIVASMAQESEYKIEGKLNESVNGQLILIADTEQGMIDIGDVMVTNGHFEFTGRMPEVTVVYLLTNKNVALATMMLENAYYTVTGDLNRLTVEGGGEAQKIWKEFQEVVTKVEAEELALLQKYNNSIVSAYVVFSNMQQGMDEMRLIERFGMLGENAKETFYGKLLTTGLAKMQNVAIGAIAPDFKVPLSDGGVQVLHEIMAKVKIVNFWASWSVPCRQENVTLLTLYKRFRPKGLEIISVSLDNNKNAWLTAIGEDGSNWKNVSDLKGQKSEVVAEYSVRAIPSIFILDEENRIVAKNLYGKELEKKITEMLKKKR